MHSEHDLQYSATTGQVYKIWIVTILLSILTLGIYRFWGKTRLRRYTTAGFSLENDHFEYTGTGGELFWGFIKALFFLLLISTPFFWAVWETNKFDKNVTMGLRTKVENVAEDVESDLKEQMHETMGNLNDAQEQSHNQNSVTSTPAERHETESSTNQTSDDASINASVTTTNPNHDTKIGAYQYTVLGIIFAYVILYAGVFPFIAVFQSFKYRVSRVRFRGIRGHAVGSSLKYGIFGLIHTLLTLVTLGLWKPIADLRLYRYKIKRLSFGNQPATFRAPYVSIFFYFIFWYLLLIIGAILSSSADLLPLLVDDKLLNHITGSFVSYEQLIAWSVSLTITGGVILVIAIIALTFGYRAALDRAKYNRLMFGDISFHCTMTGWRLFKLFFGNMLIIVLTLGIGLPWASQRKRRFLSNNLKVIGDLQHSDVMQAEGMEDNSGEGLLSFFDIQVKMF